MELLALHRVRSRLVGPAHWWDQIELQFEDLESSATEDEIAAEMAEFDRLDAPFTELVFRAGDLAAFDRPQNR
jgi:hypothetical protein